MLLHRGVFLSVRLVGLGVALAVWVGCGGTPQPVAPPDPDVGELEALVPDGVRLVVITEPRSLWASEPTRRVLSAAFVESQLELYAARTGVDPRLLDELIVATHPVHGSLLLARGDVDARFAVLEAGERMAPLEAASDNPVLRRAGFLGAHRVEVAALDQRTLMRVDGTPQLAAAVLASARRPGRRSYRSGRGVEELITSLESAPFRLIAPRPLDLPRSTGIGMLFAGERALGLTARPFESDELHVRGVLVGDFPPSASGNLRAFAESIAFSDLGTALGLREAMATLEITMEENGVRVGAHFSSASVARGLRTVLSAEMRELLELPGDPSFGLPPSRREGP